MAFAEVPPLARIHDGDRKPGLGERNRGEHFEAAGGFHDNQDRSERDESRHQLREALIIIGDGPGLPVGKRGDVERRLRNVDADVTVHERLRARHDRRGPTLRDAGSNPGQLFGLSAINTGWHPG
jgi:hypothetical protein